MAIPGSISNSPSTEFPQPFNVFFDLQIGGFQRTYAAPDNTNIMMDFDISAENNQVILTLFDATGKEVQDAIWNAVDPQSGVIGGSFQFGYLGSNPKQSIRYKFQLEDFIPKQVNNSFIITLIGFVLLSPIISTNQYSGTIEEMLTKIAQTHNMTLNIDPPFGTFYMQDSGYVDKDSTDLMEMQHIKWVTESDWAFICHVIDWAKDQSGKGGYRAYITNDENGNSVLNICRPQLSSAAYTFTVQDPDTTVIEWSPDVNFCAAVFNANGVQENGYQMHTGDEQKFVADQSVTASQQTLFTSNQGGSPLVASTPVNSEQPDSIYYFNSENNPASVTGSSVRNRPGVTSTPYAGSNPFINDHLKNWMSSITATLIVKGDPTIDPFNGTTAIQNVEVTNYYPQNYVTGKYGQELQYTSGMYQILGVRHSMKAGEYHTILTLVRAADNTPDTNVEPVQSTISVEST
jgi:hypothetical protein